MGLEREIEIQKNAAEFIRTLEMELKGLQKTQRQLGWAQRNAVYDHVSAGYTLHQKVLTSKHKWEQITFKCNLLKDIIDLLISHRDIFGLYDQLGMKKNLEQQLKLAEERNEFVIAQLLLNCLNKLDLALDN